MKKTDTVKLLVVINTAFPNVQVTESMVELWHELLGDLEFNLALAAVKKLILESPYPPTIADVRKRAIEITTPPEDRIEAAQAWGEVIKAIRNFGHYREEEALASLSPLTAQVVRCMGWREICMSQESTGVLRGQFLRMYDQVASRKQKEQLLPSMMREQLTNLRLIEAGR